MKADATNHAISWFKREADAETLDLSPSFQRRPIWDDDQASYLIDSILNNYPIPEVYIRSESDEDGTLRHEVIDGQQRIRSILRFAENDLELHADELTLSLTGVSFEDLTTPQKTAFWNYKVVVRELGETTDPEIKELFRRVNLNSVELNDQELRHAHFEGHFIKVLEDLADDPWWLEHGLFTVREIRRMTDVEFISELMVGLMAGPQNKKLSLDGYYVDYESEWEDQTYWKKLFKTTRDVIEDITDGTLGRWKSKSEFYSLFLVTGDLLYRDYIFGTAEAEAVAAALADFRIEVDQAKKRDNGEVFEDHVHRYAEAVTRASTDLSRRATRDEILRSLVLEALGVD